MVYSNVFLFDLCDSAEEGKSGETVVRKLEAAKCLFYQVLYGYVNTLTRNK